MYNGRFQNLLKIQKSIQYFIVISVFLLGSILSWMYSNDNMIPRYSENLKEWLIDKQRQQSRYILQGIKQCVINWIDYFQKHNMTVTMQTVNMIVDFCAAGHRSAGPTGDYFSIWDYCPKFGVPCFGGDNSPDCQGYSNTRTIYDELIWQKPAKKFIKKYIEENNITDTRLLEMIKPDHWIWWDDVKYIKTHYPDLYRQLHDTSKPNKLRIIMHNKPELAVKALDKMLTFFDSNKNFNAYWQFDNSKEYLEWKVIRSHDTNVWNQKIRITSTPSNDTSSYGRLLVAIGFQEDELFDKRFKTMMEQYKQSWKILKLMLYVFIILNLFATALYAKVSYDISILKAQQSNNGKSKIKDKTQETKN